MHNKTLFKGDNYYREKWEITQIKGIGNAGDKEGMVWLKLINVGGVGFFETQTCTPHNNWKILHKDMKRERIVNRGNSQCKTPTKGMWLFKEQLRRV